MLSDKLHAALNDQLNYEFYSAHAYLAMAAYCSDKSYDGFANFFLIQAEEERFHAMKFYHFLSDMGYRAFNTLIAKISRIQNDSNALFMLDAELATRTFNPVAE